MKKNKLIIVPFMVLACGLSSCNSQGVKVEDKEAALNYLSAVTNTYTNIDNLGVNIDIKDFKANGNLETLLEDENYDKLPSPINNEFRANYGSNLKHSYQKYNLNNLNSNISLRASNLGHDNVSKLVDPDTKTKYDVFLNNAILDLNKLDFNLDIKDQLVDVSTNIKNNSTNFRMFFENCTPKNPGFGSSSEMNSYINYTNINALGNDIYNALLESVNNYEAKGKEYARTSTSSPLADYCYDMSDNLLDSLMQYQERYFKLSNHVYLNDLFSGGVLGSEVNPFDEIAEKIITKRDALDKMGENEYLNMFKGFKTICEDKLECYKNGNRYTYKLDLDYKLLRKIIEQYDKESIQKIPNFKGNVYLSLLTNEKNEISNIGIEFKDFTLDTSVTLNQIFDIVDIVEDNVTDITIEEAVKSALDNSVTFLSGDDDTKFTIEELNGKINIDLDYTVSVDDLEEIIEKEKENYTYEEQPQEKAIPYDCYDMEIKNGSFFLNYDPDAFQFDDNSLRLEDGFELVYTPIEGEQTALKFTNLGITTEGTTIIITPINEDFFTSNGFYNASFTLNYTLNGKKFYTAFSPEWQEGEILDTEVNVIFNDTWYHSNGTNKYITIGTTGFDSINFTDFKVTDIQVFDSFSQQYKSCEYGSYEFNSDSGVFTLNGISDDITENTNTNVLKFYLHYKKNGIKYYYNYRY